MPATVGAGLTSLLAALILMLVVARIFPSRHAFEGMAAYLPLHTAMELFSIVVSLMLFTVGWNAYNRQRARNVVILSCAFLAVGLIDFAHTFSYPGMPELVTPSGAEKAISFWLAARALAALALLGAALLAWQPFASPRMRCWLLVTALSITALTYWVVLFHQDELPATFVAGQGLTRFKIGAEYALMAVYGMAAAVFYARLLRGERADYLRQLFAASCVTGLSELLFTFYGDVTDLYNLLGHIYKVIAYSLIYRAIFVHAIRQPYGELRRAQRALQESEERFRSLLALSSDGYWEQDAEFRFSLMSHGVWATTDLRLDHLLRKRLWELPVTGVREADWEQHRRTLEQHLPFRDFEYEIAGEDGALRWFSVSGEPVFDEEGTYRGYRGTGKDITERKQAEARQARLAAIVACSQDAIISRNLDGKVVSWNAGAERLFGYTAAEVMGRDISFIIPPDHEQEVARNRAMLAQGRALPDYETVRLAKGGRRVNVSLSRSPIKDERGTMVGVSLIFRDISEPKQAAARLARLGRAHRVMAECNQALVHAATERDLMREMCEILVNSGGFRQAWIGLPVDDELKSIDIGGSAGYEAGYLEALERSWAADGQHHGIMGHVIATGAPVVSQNILTDTRFAGRRARALDRNYQSSVSLPLKDNVRVIGGISIYAVEPDAFDHDELELLRQLAEDIAFGIVNIRTRIAHEQAEARLGEHKRRFQHIFNQAAVGMALGNLEGRYVLVNQQFAGMLGYSREELTDTAVLDHLPPEEHAQIGESRKKLMNGEVDNITDERRYVRKDGRLIWARRTLSLARDETGAPLYFISVAADITESKEREEHYRAIFANAAVGITRVDLDGKLTEVNQKFCDMLGYTRDQLIGRTVRDVTHADDYEQGMRYRAEFARGRLTSAAGEKRFVRRDGTIIWARRTISAVHDHARNAQYLISVVEDVTDRKLAEEKLKEREASLRAANERLEMLVESSPLAIYTRDRNGLLTSWNPAAEKMYGWKAAEVLGKPLPSVPDDQRAESDALRMRVLAGEVFIRQEARRRRRDVSPIDIDSFLGPLRDASGNITGIIAVVADITERKRAETERNQLATIVQNANDAIIGRSLDGTILSWNAAAERLFGYTAAEAIGCKLDQMMPAELIRERSQNRGRISRGEPLIDQETVRVTKDGRRIDVSLSVSPIKDGSGNTIGMAAIVRDISERKRAEAAQARLAAIVESSNDAIISRALDGTVLSWNSSAEKLFGHSAAEMIGKNISLITPEERIAEAQRNRDYVNAGNTLSNFETVLLAHDGRQVDVEISAAAIRHATGEVSSVAAIFRDIAERKRTEVARAQLAAIVESTNDAIISRDMNGNIRSWNAAAERMFGWSAKEAIGQPLASLIVPPETRSTLGPLIGRVMRGESVPPLEHVQMRKDGTRVDVSITFSAVKDAQGRIIALAGILRDITERKRAEETRAQLAAIVECSSDAIFSRGLDGKVLSWNAGAERLYGYSGTEIIGRDFSVIVPAERRRNGPHYWKLLGEGEPVPPHETVRMTKSGQRVHVSLSLSPIKDVDGKVTGVAAIAHDISDLKRAENAIKESEERFRATFEQAAVGMALRGVDPHNPRWLRVNQKLCDILGYTREELLELTSVDITPPEERDLAIDYNEQLLRGEITSYSREKRYMRKDGSIIWANISLSALRGPDGRPGQIISIVQDVTERKRAEEARLAADARLKHITANIPDVVFQFRRAPDGSFGFSFVSERVHDLFAEHAADVLADYRLPFTTVAPEHQRALVKSMLRSMRSRAPWSFETVIRTRDNERRWVRGQAAVSFDADGSVLWDGVLSDITLQKRAAIEVLTLNEKLEQRVAERTRQLEATNRELEAFSYSVSHDLRAPLRAIDGFSEVLLKKHAAGLDETAVDYLQRVRRAALRMGELIDDLLQLSRVSRTRIEIKTVDLSRLASSVLSELRESEPDREVATEVQDGITVRGDPRLLRIALENLLRNAWKFTRKRQPARIWFGSRKHHGEQTVFIRDNGAGFDMKYAHKLFGAFQRLHGVNDFEGTGIGLATVQRIVHLHGGRVWTDAAVDQGASFYLVIPHSARNEVITTRQGEQAWPAPTRAN